MGAADCIVVRVVVNDLTDGAGEENVLPAPFPVLVAYPAVAVVASPDDGACEVAASERATSVDTVAVTDLFGGGSPSDDDSRESPGGSKEELLELRPVGAVENDKWPLVYATGFPEAAYGLFLNVAFFEFPFARYAFRFPPVE